MTDRSFDHSSEADTEITVAGDMFEREIQGPKAMGCSSNLAPFKLLRAEYILLKHRDHPQQCLYVMKILFCIPAAGR